MTIKKAPGSRKAVAAMLTRTVRAGKGKKATAKFLTRNVRRDPVTGRLSIDGVSEQQIVKLGPKVHPIEVSAAPRRLTMDQIDRLVASMQVR